MSDTIENYAALQQFVDGSGLKRSSTGRVNFDAYVTIEMDGAGGGGLTKARISFANGDRDQLILEEGDSFTDGSHPLSYNADYGTWTCVDDALVIEGVYKKKAYRTEVKVDV